MFRATCIAVQWFVSSSQLTPRGAMHPVAVWRVGSAVLLLAMLAFLVAAMYLLRTRGARAHVRFRPVLRFDPTTRLLRLFRLTRTVGNVGDGKGYSSKTTLALAPKLFSHRRETDGRILTVCGLRFHHQRSYGGIFAAALLAVLATVNTGCTITAHDPANQAAINNRQRVNTMWTGYTAALRTVDQLYKGGAISKADATTARNVLVDDVRPLIQTAQDALVNGNPEAAIQSAEQALQNIVNSLDTKKATTRPAVLRLESPYHVPYVLAA